MFHSADRRVDAGTDGDPLVLTWLLGPCSLSARSTFPPATASGHNVPHPPSYADPVRWSLCRAAYGGAGLRFIICDLRSSVWETELRFALGLHPAASMSTPWFRPTAAALAVRGGPAPCSTGCPWRSCMLPGGLFLDVTPAARRADPALAAHRHRGGRRPPPFPGRHAVAQILARGGRPSRVACARRRPPPNLPGPLCTTTRPEVRPVAPSTTALSPRGRFAEESHPWLRGSNLLLPPSCSSSFRGVEHVAARFCMGGLWTRPTCGVERSGSTLHESAALLTPALFGADLRGASLLCLPGWTPFSCPCAVARDGSVALSMRDL